MYRSRFGRIVVKGRVKGGQVETYYVTVNNNAPVAAGTLPASVAQCAQSKRLPAPPLAGMGQRAEACRGERFQVLVSHAEGKRYVLLYAQQSGAWQLCSAGTA